MRSAASAAATDPGTTPAAGRGGAPLVERIRASVIGDNAVLEGPFGARRIVYTDSTASGRALTFVERFIRDRVLPLYGNTHTEASATGQQTTRLREEARGLIHEAVGASADDVVLFCGSGSTGAIDRLARVVGLSTDGAHRRFAPLPPERRPVVFIGPYEHHSNELPWRESIADVVTIQADRDGQIDLEHLDFELERFARRPLLIGSFSAASNVTGAITDVDAVSIALHRRGALAWWDYAAAGPHLPIAMNPSPPVPDSELAYKDAVFLSPHKLIGGPGTPGVLVAKRHHFRNATPSVPGGGTILFVGPTRHRYHDDPVIREEGGTPAIVESIRAGIVFALKEAVGADEIRRRERDFVARALESWRANPRVEILGDPLRERLPIVTFGLRHPPGILHSAFVVSVLSDLFGIQARSGCFCAGPYIHRIYPIDEAWSRAMDAETARGHIGAKLALVRIGFDYFMSETAFEYVLESVHLLADEAWRLLPYYRFDPRTGSWSHRSGRSAASLSLHDVSFDSEPLVAGSLRTMPEGVLARQLEEARRLFRRLERFAPPTPDDGPLDAGIERIRWFPLSGALQSPLSEEAV